MSLDDLNRFADSVAGPSNPGYKTSMDSAMDIDPDAYAELKRSARRLNVPVSLLPAQKADRRRLQMQADPQYSDLAKTHPQTARWLSDPENAKVAHDDVENLSGIEKFFTEYMKKPAARTINNLGQFVDLLGFPAASAIDKIRGNDNLKQKLFERIEKFQTQNRAAQADPNTSFGGRLVQSLEELAPLMLTGPVAPYLIAGEGATSQGLNLAEQGVKGKTLVGLSALSGATAFAMTKLPFAGKATGNMVKDVAKGAARGAVFNPILGLVERTAEKGVLKVAGYDQAADRTKIFDPEAISTDVALGVLFGAHAGWGARQAKAQQNAAAMIAVTNLFKDSKVRDRFTPAFHDYVTKAAEQAGLEHIGMPVEKFEEFYQSAGLAPEQVLTDPNAYYEAKATGSDVVIPMADYAAHMAPHMTDEHMKDIRMGFGADTLRETEEAGAEEDKAVADFRATAEKAESDASLKQSEHKVYDDVFGQLLGINIPRDVAEKQAALWAIRARTRATRLGVDPYELYRERPLEVVRPQPDLYRPKQPNKYEDILNALYMQKGLRRGKEWTDSDFQNYLKENYPSAAGMDKQTVLSALDNITKGKALTDKQKGVIEAIDSDIARYETETKPTLRPAIVNQDGKVIEGDTGGRHDDIIQENNVEPGTEQRGFVDDAGNFMDRSQAEQWLKDNDQATYERWKAEHPEDELHSQPYAEARQLFQSNKINSTKLYKGVFPDIERSEGSKGVEQGGFWTTDRSMAEYYAAAGGSRKDGKIIEATLDPAAKVLTLINAYGEIDLKGVKEWEKITGTVFDANRLIEKGLEGYTEKFKEAGYDVVHSMDIDGPETLILNKKVLLDDEKKQKFFQSSPDSRQGAETYSIRKTQAEGMLAPAVLKDGEVTAAGIGATHYDVHSKVKAEVPEGAKDANGFLAPDNKFLDRKQALEWLKENRPDVYKALSKETKKSGLESQDYASAEGAGGETALLAEDFMKRQFGPEVFFQGDADKRAYIKIGSQKIEIGLLEKADLSSFLHESGHAWFEEFKKDALRPDAPQQLKDDWEAIKKWSGATDEDIPTDAHEKFAKGMEKYFEEGKAPSEELMPLFQRFKAWIKQVYSKLRGLNVSLTDDVREVMDRMLATDEEINRAEEMMNLKPLFATAKDAGMTEAEFSLYKKTAQQAHEAHSARLMKRVMDEVKREQKQWWRDERAKMQEGVSAEAKENPVYKAFQVLSRGEDFEGNKIEPALKLSRPDLVKMYGEDFVKRLPRSVKAVYAEEGGIHPDIAAEMFSFGSGDEMVRKMAEAPKMDRFIASETRARMLEKYGDIQHDGSMAEEALKAIHGDTAGEVLRAELRAIERKRKEVRPFLKEKEGEARQAQKEMKETIPPLKHFKEIAAQIIGEKALRHIQPTVYARAEAKAGREAFEAAGKQDFAKARDAKVQQLTNHFLYMEAVKAQDEAAKIYDYMRKIDDPKKLGPVGKASQGLLEQLQKIISRYEFRKIPFSILDQEKSLKEWINQFEAEHEDRQIPIDPQILDESYRVNYREIPMDELRSVYDSVRAIVHAARQVSEVQLENRRVSEELAADNLINAKGVQTFKPEPFRPTEDGIPRMQKFFRTAKKLNAGLRREEFLFELLDGAPEGPWHDFFWNGYLRSESKRREILDRIHEPIQKAVEDMPKEQRDRLADKSLVHVKSLQADLSRNELFSILMNLGNESNEMKMMNGGFMYGDGSKQLTDEARDEILSTFTKADFDLAQTLWNAVNTVRQDIIDLNRRWTGLEPAMVEARPLETPFGTYEGGYWPVKYDPRGSSFGEKQDDAAKSVQEMVNFRYGGKQTQKGYMKERTEARAPILLDWKTVAARHMNDVATDLAYREWASDARRLLKRNDLKTEMMSRLGKTEYDNMRAWIDSTIAKDSWGTPGTSAWENIYRAGYAHFTTAVLGANMAAAFADVSITPVLTATRVSPKYILSGYKEFFKNPKATNELIKQKSEWQARIEDNVDQSLRNSLDYLAAHSSKYQKLMAMALEMRVWLYKQAANSAWIGAYREAIAQGKTEIQAVRIADKVPRMTQDAGDIGSISALERHPFWKKMLVYAGALEVAYNAAMNAAHDIRASKGTDPGAWGRLFAFWFSQSVLWAAVRGRKDKDESWGGFVARHMALGPLEAFPIVRDVTEYAEKKLKGQRAEIRSMPIIALPKAWVDAVSSTLKYSQGEGELKNVVKDVNIAAGMTAGYPAFQADITGQFLYDVLSGQYQPKHFYSPLKDIFYRRKKGDEE